MIIYLDIDGVCVDLVSAACQLHNYHYQEEIWPAGQRDLHKVIGVAYDDFWNHIHQCGSNFWLGLKPYPWFERLYAELNKMGEVYFLTSPTNSPHCASGKMMWLKNRFGTDFNRFIITRHKHLFSFYGSILIDDYEYNIDNFEKYGGGKAILFPQKWNRAYEQVSCDRVNWVIDRIRQLR